jgi:hypothetical protein
MRHGTQQRRQRHNNNPRGNGHGNGGGRRPFQQPRTQVYDSNGPDVRIRGTAHQVAEKYLTLAKDAASSGDRVLAESYLQHAEHYQRMINSWGDDVQAPPALNRFSQGSDQNTGEEEANVVEKQPQPESDLSLPASILGNFSKENPEASMAARTDGLLVT